MNHPPFEQLVDLVEDRLAPPLEERTRQHLESGCVACRDRMRWVTWLRERMLADVTAAVPAWLEARAFGLFDSRRALPEAPPQGRHIASLLHDSLTCAGATDLREDKSAKSQSLDRYLLFRAGAFDIDIQIWSDQDVQSAVARHQILGQVLRRGTTDPPEALDIELVIGDRVIASTTTDAFGEFRLTDLPAETVDLRLKPPAAPEILLLGIDIKPSSSDRSD